MNNNANHQSRFITFEGIDRCGKSTQSKELKRKLDQIGIRCIVTAEPGGSGEIGTIIRDALLNPQLERTEITAALLFNADRHEHVKKIIEPTLAKGIWVICDRFYDSTLAYQGAGGNVDKEVLEQLNNLACGELKPDLTILLELDPEQRFKRSPKLDYYDQGKDEYEAKVTTCFKQLAKEEPQRIMTVDGNAEITEIADIIFNEVKQRFINNDS